MSSKKYLSLDGLIEYDALIKQEIADLASDASAKLTEAKTYADNAANAVKNDLLNNAGAAYDTLKELGDLIDDNRDAIDALETVAAGKANATHSHAIADVSGLQAALDSKADSSALNNYYTKTQIDSYSFITIDDIDAICGSTISYAENMMF